MMKHLRFFRKLTINFINKFKQKIELLKYNDFTIAKYLRKQGAQIGENNRIMIRNLADEACLIRIAEVSPFCDYQDMQ